jgi:hypothetical protein
MIPGTGLSRHRSIPQEAHLMANNKKKMDPDTNSHKRSAVEDDVEGHGLNTRSAPEGATSNKRMSPDGVGGTHKRSAVEDDVEGHGLNTRSAPEGATSNKRMSPDGVGGTHKRSAVEDDDVEGHSFGTMNPILARDLARSKDRDIERSTSRNNLVSEAKRGTPRKG